MTSYKFPELPYAYDALEPHVDKQTMEIHYSKHHNGYFTKYQAAAEGTEFADKALEDTFASISKAPGAIRNNGGGFYNHVVFWNSMAPNAGGTPSGEVGKAIGGQWGSFDKFKEEFSNAAATRFGSGWAWLVVKDNGDIAIASTPNQDNPLMDTAEVRGTPILGLDVWEHAYYLKYQNKRPDYVSAWWNVVNWKKVEELYAKAKAGDKKIWQPYMS